jgi:dienelactone hydrolase
MRRFLTAASLLLGIGNLSVAQESGVKPGFVTKLHKGSQGNAKYTVFIPKNYNADKEYPLIVYLHGSGGQGNDGVGPSNDALGQVARRKPDFPFIVLFPQAQEWGHAWQAHSRDSRRAQLMLADVKKDYKVDARRIYLTGLSMGGFGTWSWAAAYPKRWAAIVPLCGGGNPRDADKTHHIPCWCFHGELDRAVPVEQSRKMIAAIKNAGGSPIYTEFPFVEHNCWDRAYNDGRLYEWMLKHRLKEAEPPDTPPFTVAVAKAEELKLDKGTASVTTALAADDAEDVVRRHPCRVYTVKLHRGMTYQIDMVSQGKTKLDPFLRLENEAGKELAHDDDSGGALNARIVFACPADGLYRIIATTYAGGTGRFMLVVQQK